MVFSSLSFLFLFLPVTLACYFLAGRSYRNAILLCASYVFYFWGGGAFLLILVISTAVDYIIALLIDRWPTSSKRFWVTVSIVFNLTVLAVYKYANFFFSELNKGLALFDQPPIFWTLVILPIGISFFTFQKITYIVDVYRGTRRAFTSFVDFALYVAMFPQLIAGPIVRFHEISEQIRSRTETIDLFHQGILRFFWGFTKKIVLANACGEIADAVFGFGLELNTPLAWLGVFAYTLQIYLDFSAYSDMAIGLGQMFGFRLPENFNRPYSAVSITDFWRRWHMTLSRFFRDYVYIPLGGSRAGSVRTHVNLITVFLLCGLWHGANWTFLIWGIYHGLLLLAERHLALATPLSLGHQWLRRSSTLLLVMIGWVFFRADTVGQALQMFSVMFWPTAHDLPMAWFEGINGRNLFFLAVSSLVLVLPRELTVQRLLATPVPALAAVRTAALFALTIYSLTFLAASSFNPFIYFRF